MVSSNSEMRTQIQWISLHLVLWKIASKTFTLVNGEMDNVGAKVLTTGRMELYTRVPGKRTLQKDLGEYIIKMEICMKGNGKTKKEKEEGCITILEGRNTRESGKMIYRMGEDLSSC